MEVLVAILGVVGILALALIYSAIAYGVVTYQFYYWFILPVFHGLPAITFAHAIGIAFFISLFKGGSGDFKYTYKGNEIKKEVNYWGAILSPWIVLGVGWGVKCIFL